MTWRRNWQCGPVSLARKFHGQSLEGYSPRGHTKSEMTERLDTHTHTHTHSSSNIMVLAQFKYRRYRFSICHCLMWQENRGWIWEAREGDRMNTRRLVKKPFVYKVMLVSSVKQSDSVIHIHICIHIFFRLFSHIRLSKSIEYSSLCYTQLGPCLSILYIVVYVCYSQISNLSLPLSLSPLVRISLFSKYVSMFPFCK